MSNFIGMVFASLKNEGIDTKGMSTDEAVKKYNELQKKTGGKAGANQPTPAENRKYGTNNKRSFNYRTTGDIDYQNIKYPQGTSKEYTFKVNEKYEKAMPLLEAMGVKESDFGGQPSKEGGFEDNTKELLDKYVFEPFNKRYPKGNNEMWKNHYQPIYDAIEAVADKHYNDYWIKTH